ncbi:hypothetical protein CTAYLR_006927 [Chrysophaeum taylorii]|uniref:Uncharacterized protein n=1 Tax=Chrysophaeum taylorii TaxID=2483200 RepID=A0AAD7UA38_9STRA|nr:hypothetical protein CTAYLR_006927 [Chrysophaeum taylorii]
MMIWAILVTSVAAFAPPSAVRPSLALHAELSTMPGISVETGNKVFDPLGLAQWRDIEELRATELANGRSAMLAVVGWVWPQVFGLWPGGSVTTTDPIAAISQVEPEAWAQMIILCGCAEAAKVNWASGVDAKPFFDPDALFFDPAKVYPADPAGQEEMQLKELKNGRMAMIAFAGLVVHHFNPAAVPLLGDLK